MLRAIVLGAAAGGGFPQWNSNAPGCSRARAGDPLAKRRTQASLAISADGERWVVLNASPDLRAQIEATPALQPRGAIRSSPIAAVVLTGGDVDAVAGLLHLRERQPFALYATRPVLGVLAANPIFNVLSELVDRRELPLAALALADAAGVPLGLSARAFAVPGKVPLYLETPGQVPEHRVGPETIGLALSAGGPSLGFVPGCAAITDDVHACLAEAAVVLFDGTLWADDEMIRAGLGPKTGQRMGHVSVSGPAGVMARLGDLGARRKILIHINNSNPVLLEDSAEHAAVVAAGWGVAEDGMEIAL